ncbi:acyltransferase [Methylorubrum extorquens]
MSIITDASAEQHGSVQKLFEERLFSCPYIAAPNINDLRLSSENLPEWWGESTNILLAAEGHRQPTIVGHPGILAPTNVTIIIEGGCVGPDVIMVWGDKAFIYLGPGTNIPQSQIYCGGSSTIAIGGNLSCAGGASLNARNGGTITIGADGLWSNDVYLATDDMHAILDRRTGARINPYGGLISIESHVWLGMQTMILGGAVIGQDSVVGARSVVKSEIPAASVVAGSPARVVREGITWSREDISPT